MPCPRWKDIRNVDPWQWPPTHGVETNIDIDHRCHGPRRRRWRTRACRGISRVCLEDGSDNEEQNTHAHSGDEQRHFTTKGVRQVEHKD